MSTATLSTATLSTVTVSIPMLPSTAGEVKNPMSTASVRAAIDVVSLRDPRARGIDRVVERVAIALLGWSRNRTVKRSLPRDEHARAHAEERALREREAAALRMTLVRGH